MAIPGLMSSTMLKAVEESLKPKTVGIVPQNIKDEPAPSIPVLGVVTDFKQTPQSTIGGNGRFGQSDTPTNSVADTNQQYLDQINAMKEAQRRSRIAALDSQRNSALGSLDQEQAGIAPQYYNRKNQAAAQSDVGALNFAQYMAGRGIKGPSAAMPEMYRNAALQANIGNLNAQEQGAYDTIARNRSLVNQNYQSDVEAANADVEAQGLQNYINQMNANRTFAYNAGQDSINNQFRQSQFDYGKQQDTIQNQQWQQQFNYNAGRDQVLDDRWMQQFNADQKQQILDNAYRNKQISLDEYQAKTSRINATNSTSRASTSNLGDTGRSYDQWYTEGRNMLNQMVDAKDYLGNDQKINKYSKYQVKQWILGLNVPDAEKVRMINDLGVGSATKTDGM